MKHDFLNQKGVEILTKNQLKSVNGSYRNCVKTGQNQLLMSPDSSEGGIVAVAVACEWRCEREFLGIAGGTWGYINLWEGC